MAHEWRQLSGSVRSLHPAWQAWTALLVVVNGLLPFLFLPSLAALVTLAAMAASVALAYVLLRLHGFSKLLGAAHLPWLPMVTAQVGLHPGLVLS